MYVVCVHALIDTLQQRKLQEVIILHPVHSYELTKDAKEIDNNNQMLR